MAYVALGRTEQLKDIYIRGQVGPEGIHASEVALEETNRLQRMFDERDLDVDYAVIHDNVPSEFNVDYWFEKSLWSQYLYVLC